MKAVLANVDADRRHNVCRFTRHSPCSFRRLHSPKPKGAIKSTVGPSHFRTLMPLDARLVIVSSGRPLAGLTSPAPAPTVWAVPVNYPAGAVGRTFVRLQAA